MFSHKKFDLNRNELNALLQFEGLLEQSFLADIETRFSVSNGFIGMAVEVKSRYNLAHGLSVLGPLFRGDGLKINVNANESFKYSIDRLSQSFRFQIRLQELALYFNDTDVIINGIFQDRILNEAEVVMQALIDHFPFYTLCGMPYEIHIPVIDEATDKLISEILKNLVTSNRSSPYLKYWALYFDTLPYVGVYDLGSMGVVPGELTMLSDQGGCSL